jgi:hypothetical protein
VGWFGRKAGGRPDDANPGARGAPEGSGGADAVWDAPDSTRMVVECCASRLPAVAVSWPHGGVARCRFREIGHGKLTLDADGALDLDTFPALAVAVVSFHWGGRARVFLSPVLPAAAGAAGGPEILTLRAPDRIAGAEARLSVRVPVPGAELVTELRTPDGDALPVRAVDISVTGLLVDVPIAAGREFSAGDLLRVRIEHGSRSAVVDAVVRRRDGSRYGLFFPGAIDREDAGDAASVREIVAPLVRSWLSRRG